MARMKTSKGIMPHLDIFDELLDHVQQDWEGLEVDFAIGEDDEFPEDRDFAYTEEEGGEICIVMAPKLATQPMERIRAVLMHEFGHAIDLSYDKEEIEETYYDDDREGEEDADLILPKTPERRADAIAEAAFGQRIFYDSENVETTIEEDGVHPRPKKLGL